MTSIQFKYDRRTVFSRMLVEVGHVGGYTICYRLTISQAFKTLCSVVFERSIGNFSYVAKNLKRCVGEHWMMKNGLRLFLCFCLPRTSRSLKPADFSVIFKQTCVDAISCYLINYQNYPDLCSDFNAILNSSVWVMDIV